MNFVKFLIASDIQLYPSVQVWEDHIYITDTSQQMSQSIIILNKTELTEMGKYIQRKKMTFSVSNVISVEQKHGHCLFRFCFLHCSLFLFYFRLPKLNTVT